ncbi:MATE family efflux transporter [Paenibacillus sp. GCM10012307]|uniref:MATE family efflux transporter n=1 Tax=Paenibacillus roseus TaxID=2798579 RepID=A0A934IVJ1_9BACL|nr:MATE family efflux transporter [Paenibacillus roseus]MBJ6360077.1 MATE family efflux transporter [Paenibacillus roseus]
MSTLDLQFRIDMRKLVLPSVLQMLVGNSFSLINTLMVGSLGDAAVAAIAAAGQISFILSMILSAIFGITAFITQFYGKADRMNMRKAFGLMLISSVVITLVVCALVSGFKEPILSLFMKDEVAVAYGVHYLSVIVFVYLINSIKDVYGSALGSIGQVKLTLVVGVIAMIVNVGLDYVLIYGKLGFPRYGIVGAAWATLVSSMIGAILLIGYVYWKKYEINLKLRELFSLDWPFIKKVYGTTLPLLFHEGMWSIGNMLYAVAFGHLGVAALATFQLANTFQGYFMVGIFGFAYAAKVMIGQKLSLESPDEAIVYARKFTRIGLYAALIASVVILLISPFLYKLFPNLSTEVQSSFRNIMIIQALVMVMFFLNNLWIVGMFRAGGDNLYTMNLILITTWVITLPLVFAGAYWFRWPVEWVYLMFTLEEVSKACIGFFRYRSNKWARNLVRDLQEEL